MCNDSASSLWKKEQEDIRGTKFTTIDPNWFSAENIPELVDSLHNLSAIQFAGGEPTISDDHIVLLKRLIELDRAKHITLGYVTNLTGISPELLELWKHFSNKYITISVDGVGPVNEYQRYPFSWKKVTSQIEALKEIAAKEGNYQIGLSHTVTSLNLLSIDETIKWWESHVESGSGIAPWLPHVQCVNNPEYLDPVYMPKEMKDEVRNTLARLEKFISEKNLVDKYLPVIKNITTNVLDVDVEEDRQRTVWLKMQKFLTDLDKYRGRNIFNYLSYMKKYWIEE
jgi:MoaA/NifB/PqqE/SkfB family radical SAM enzyme